MGAALGELGDKGGGEQSEQSVSFPGPQRSPRIFCGAEDSKVNTRLSLPCFPVAVMKIP